jgi:hypothetical protein
MDTAIQSLSSVVTSNWVHVAAVRDVGASSISILVNGVVEATRYSANKGPLSDPMRIYFGTAGGYRFYQGLMDEVRFWNVARTDTDIQSTMHVTLKGDEPGLVGYYRFDEGMGALVGDSSPSANSGTLGDGSPSAAPTWVPAGEPICKAQ